MSHPRAAQACCASRTWSGPTLLCTTAWLCCQGKAAVSSAPGCPPGLLPGGPSLVLFCPWTLLPALGGTHGATCLAGLHLLVLGRGALARRGSPGRVWVPGRMGWGRGPARWWAAARGCRRPGTLPCLPSTSGRGCSLRRVRAVAGCSVRDSARARRGRPASVYLPWTPSPPRLDFGEGARLAGTPGPIAHSPSRSFLRSRWRRRGSGEEAGEGRFAGPSPPERSDCSGSLWRPAPVPGCWGGGRAAVAPPPRVAPGRRMSGSDEGRWATILLVLGPMQVCAVSGHGGAFTSLS